MHALIEPAYFHIFNKYLQDMERLDNAIAG